MITIITRQIVEITKDDPRFEEYRKRFENNNAYDNGCYNCDGSILIFESYLNEIEL